MSSSNAGKVIVGTVSGTSISFGTAATYSHQISSYSSLVYDSTYDKVVVAYKPTVNSGGATVNVGTVSGTSVSFGSSVFLESGQSDWVSSTFDSTNGKVVVAYKDTPASDSKAVVFQNAGTGTNLTSENFIGFSDAAYSDGDTATVQVVTALDDAQSGLTTGSKHYVQNDGTLSTTAGSPSVLAGTAISDTEIIVKQ